MPAFKPDASSIAMIVAIIIAIVIIIVVIMQIRRVTKEGFESGVITVPYDPLSGYTLIPEKDSHSFADIGQVTDAPSGDPAKMHAVIAARCDANPLCVAFNSAGHLKSGYLPQSAHRVDNYARISGCTGSTCGMFVRKGSVPEKLYVELFVHRDYGTPRLLLAPGNYPDISLASGTSGAIGGPMGNDALSSLRIPRGIKVVLYGDKNYGGKSLALTRGNYSDLKAQGWNDDTSSIKVMYDRN